MKDLLISIYGNDQLKYLIGLVLANVVLAILASLKSRDFRLTRVADWLEHLFYMVVGYGVAGGLAYVNPDLGVVKDAAFYSLGAVALGYIFSQLKDFGLNLPDQIAGKPK